jgi:hypothetical protein
VAFWYVWGDYVHTQPERIGNARRVEGHEKAARHAAESLGFDFTQRLRNGFEPWTAAFAAEESADGQDFQFASYPTVRGWKRLH